MRDKEGKEWAGRDETKLAKLNVSKRDFEFWFCSVSSGVTYDGDYGSLLGC